MSSITCVSLDYHRHSQTVTNKKQHATLHDSLNYNPSNQSIRTNYHPQNFGSLHEWLYWCNWRMNSQNQVGLQHLIQWWKLTRLVEALAILQEGKKQAALPNIYQRYWHIIQFNLMMDASLCHCPHKNHSNQKWTSDQHAGQTRKQWNTFLIYYN